MKTEQTIILYHLFYLLVLFFVFQNLGATVLVVDSLKFAEERSIDWEEISSGGNP